MIPFTVVGGFLGAGKTTLVNEILRAANGERITVLVNDFGATPIDADLIARHDGDTITLTNGCICCALGGGFTLVIAQLLNTSPPPDRVVVEASGIGEPRKIAQYGTLPGFALDGVVVVADAETIRANAGDHRIGAQVRAQLDQADLIVINKLDLVTTEASEELTAWMAASHPTARLVGSTNGVIPRSVLFGLGGAGSFEIDTDPSASDAHGFATTTIAVPDGTDRAVVLDLLNGLEPTVLRVKGFVRLAGDDHDTLVQRVGTRTTLRPAPLGARHTNTLVLIILATGPTATDGVGDR